MVPKKKFLIGRDRSCDIVVDDAATSRCHAELELLDDGRWYLTDRRSTHGTFLITPAGERRISQEYVSPGDTLRFGEREETVRELLDDIGRKYPDAWSHGEDSPLQSDPWAVSRNLRRCQRCAAPKKSNQPCPACGYGAW
jgi:hypothetical protein